MIISNYYITINELFFIIQDDYIIIFISTTTSIKIIKDNYFKI